MTRILRLTLCCLAAALFVVGCSSDTPTNPAAGTRNAKTVISGDIDPGTVAFEYSAAAPGDPSPGMFRIEGSNLRYEADPGALLADIVLVNDSSADFDGPVRLVFMQLLPAGVTVLNADNADSAMGAGAMFTFAFADTDTVWSAGAATEARTVQFGVEPGTSIGFVARIQAGDEPAPGGAVGGMVWHDLNENGVADAGEAGVVNIALVLNAGTADESGETMMSTLTDRAGMYRFEALPSGHYTVSLADDARIMPTTSPVMEVLLVEYDGQVMDFLGADFGVIRAGMPDSSACVEVGDCINAKGIYMGEPDRLEGRIVNVCGRERDCEDDDDDDCEDCGEDKSDEGMCWGRLSGPITEINRERQAIAVMGTWIHLSDADWDKGHHDGDIGVGTRVRVNAELESGEDGDRVVACRIHKWNGNGDRVRGTVQEVVRDEAGAPVGVRVLNTLVTLPGGFDCDDDDRGDDVR